MTRAFEIPDPYAQPAQDAPRLQKMTWENRWRDAFAHKDPALLALMIGSGLNTPEKHEQAVLGMMEMSKSRGNFDSKCFRLLLKAGAHVPPEAVPMLCSHGVGVIRLLEKHGADLAGTNRLGESALHLAATLASDYEFARIWQYLLGKGLDPNATDNMHETPLTIADDCGRSELAERVINAHRAGHEAVVIEKKTPAAAKSSSRSRL